MKLITIFKFIKLGAHMKITLKQLKHLIKEEITNINEAFGRAGTPGGDEVSEFEQRAREAEYERERERKAAEQARLERERRGEIELPRYRIETAEEREARESREAASNRRWQEGERERRDAERAKQAGWASSARSQSKGAIEDKINRTFVPEVKRLIDKHLEGKGTGKKEPEKLPRWINQHAETVLSNVNLGDAMGDSSLPKNFKTLKSFIEFEYSGDRKTWPKTSKGKDLWLEITKIMRPGWRPGVFGLGFMGLEEMIKREVIRQVRNKR